MGDDGDYLVAEEETQILLLPLHCFYVTVIVVVLLGHDYYSRSQHHHDAAAIDGYCCGDSIGPPLPHRWYAADTETNHHSTDDCHYHVPDVDNSAVKDFVVVDDSGPDRLGCYYRLTVPDVQDYLPPVQFVMENGISGGGRPILILAHHHDLVLRTPQSALSRQQLSSSWDVDMGHPNVPHQALHLRVVVDLPRTVVVAMALSCPIVRLDTSL